MFSWVGWAVAFVFNVAMGMLVYSPLFYDENNVVGYMFVIFGLDIVAIFVFMFAGWMIDEYVKRSVSIHGKMRDRR